MVLKSKSFKAILIFFIIVTVICIGLAVDYLTLPPMTKDFLNKIGTIQEDDLKNNLKFYKDKIQQEVEGTEHRDALKHSYFSLGYIESLNEDYNQSNDYYYRALSIDSMHCDTLCGMVYRELSFNAIHQGKIEKGFEYYNLALQAFKDDEAEVMSLNYRFSQALDYTKDYKAQIIKILESNKTKKQEPFQEIQNLRLLAKIYLFSGQYSKSINYLLDAFEVSVWNDYKNLQRAITIELGNAYFLNKNYEEAVETLYPCLLTWGDLDLITYFEQLAKSLRMVYGYDYAIEFLNQHIESVKNSMTDHEIWLQFWVELLQAELSVFENKPEIAKIYLNRAQVIYEKNATSLHAMLNYWIQKIDLDILVLKGEKSNQIIEQYIDLYKKIASSDIYFISKISLLDEIINQSLKLNHYSLAYDAMKSRAQIVDNELLDDDLIDLNEIYLKTKEERQNRNVSKRIVLFFMISITTMGIGSIVCLISNHKKRILDLVTEVEAQKDFDSLTHTLTKSALYNRLEKYFGQELTFTVVQYDDLKRYNEVYGYLNGDHIIRILSNQIKNTFTQEYIARHSGHFFIIVSTDSKENCVLKVKKLLQMIYDLNIINTLVLEHRRMTVSAGLSSGIIHSKQDIDHYIKVASHHLEVSRQRGCNTFTV